VAYLVECRTSGLDESLSRLPGVVVLNRYNYSLDQRVSLRGAGSRANFGLRGVKVLIDGVPQTLPDGQSQLTNLELGTVDRVEVLTGSGDVVSFTSDLLTRVVEAAFAVILVIVISIYMLLYGDRIGARVRNAVSVFASVALAGTKPMPSPRLSRRPNAIACSTTRWPPRVSASM